jgi:hypothetical protein
MKKRLNSSFQPTKYTLQNSSELLIEGQKLGSPSKRLVFHQHGLKILKAEIIYKSKRENREIAVSRINHINTLEEVRLHTDEILYPGTYEIKINFICSKELPNEISVQR